MFTSPLVQLRLDDYDLEEFVALATQSDPCRFDYVVTPNVDHLIRYHEDAEFRRYYQAAGYVLLDSRFLARILARISSARPRVCPGSDLTARLFERLAPGDRIVLIGASGPQAVWLARRYGLDDLRHYEPPMGFIHDAGAVEECLRFVEARSPFRFCFLAVGSPQQEALAYALQRRGVARGLALCVGASINLLTGQERRAPEWMQRMGLEWLFRLLQNPHRLARRYLLRGPRIFPLLRRLQLELRRKL